MNKLAALALAAMSSLCQAQTTIDFKTPTWGPDYAAQSDFVWASSRGIGPMGGYLTGFLVQGVWLYRASGQAFDLVSLDVADFADVGNDQVRFDITWYDQAGDAHGLWGGYLDDKPGLQTFATNITGATRLVIHGKDDALFGYEDQDSRLGFGPITVRAQNLDAPPAPVPEPATYLLLLAGLALLAHAGKRT